MAAPPRALSRLLSYQDALDLPEPPWTVDGVLGGLGLLWGEAGVGKSFVACSFAAAVVTGRPWLGHRVHGGPVVYIAGEGGAASVARRLDAAISALHCCDPEDGAVPLWICSPGVDLVSGPAELLQVVGEVVPQLLIVDTLARCFGGDENSSQDMGKFVHTLDMLRELWGGSVLVVHHANKTDGVGSRRVRGSSVLYGAVDVSMQLVHSGGGAMTLVADKLRDRDVTGPAAELRFEQVGLPSGERDELGDVRMTRVVRPTVQFEMALTEVACIVLRSGVIEYSAWRAACIGIGKGEFDRLVVTVLGDPQTWGIREIAPGWYSGR